MSWSRRTLTTLGLSLLVGAGTMAFTVGATASTSRVQKTDADQTPVMGWSSWSFLRLGVNATAVEMEAQALVDSGLASVGYRYVNIDDGWYKCPGPQGPDVDQYGRWVINTPQFPTKGEMNGIEVLASYVHSLGLKFGIYETAGISRQAVAANDPILDSSLTADQIATTSAQNNYNCGGMVGLNYRSPGAQAYVDSIVDELASWGVDYIKLDGITDKNVPDIKAWSSAITQSGRPMVLDTTEGALTPKIAPQLEQYSNQWEFAPDIETSGPDEGGAPGCETSPFSGCSSVFPFTSYGHWRDRFDDVAKWQAFGGPGGFNDYDSIEVGDGSADSGMSSAGAESQLSLWALGSAPLILGSDLTSKVVNAYGSSSGLNPTDLNLLRNTQVLEVDQDSVDASRISSHGPAQVFAKAEPSGDGIVGLFDTNTQLTTADAVITTTASAIGLRHDRAGYELQNLWTGQSTQIPSAGRIVASIPPEGVALYRVTPVRSGARR
jgi:alpha galactosidase A-like protein/alpha galactosidase C-like protein